MSLIPEHALMPLRRDGLDPVPALREAREDHPVRDFPLPYGVKAWLVTGNAEARDILGRTEGLSTDFGHLVGSAGIKSGQNPGGLGFTDPPEHTRLRRLLTPEFTGRRLSRLGPRITEIVEGRLDAMAELAAAGEPVDLVRDFATPIPALTICELLGIPYDERDEFQALSTARFDLLSGATAAFDKISDSLVYLRGVVERQRDRPGEGLLGMLIREHGDELDTDELAELADGLLTGGLETSASMLALGAVILLRDPSVAAMVRDEPGSVHGFVEELLRYLTVVQIAFPRFATQDMVIGGVEVAAGDALLVSLSGADRDPRLTPDPERFDPRREPTPHLAFGHGIHRCIGAELARMELRTAYPALLRRFPHLTLAAAESTLPLRTTSVVYGVDALPVSLGAS
ncbi:cytochrome P450 [Actinomycetospora sp. TBRC 11914]|uniref:cytochrome P450 n=1 Tax=Actinomycetospora sp. TBRC 11914 TaxID=2729387 RepID=UPI001B7D7556|nr:cytochrome P450 [Actinomycetospora sp. TBRC 11914]